MYLKIILKSVIFTAAVLLIWFYFFRDNFNIFPENEEIMSAVVGGFLVFSALLPTFTISRLSQQYDELQSAILDDDFRLFRRIYKKTVHPLIYLAIIIVSLLAIFALMMLPYNRLFVGLFSVGGLSFVHCFFFFVSRELDDPNWLHLKIPREWIERLNK